jgi:mannose-1-phosphate guanylyltransferase
MKALVLVGGFGSRLKPLTDNLPKPMMHLCGYPMVEHQVNALYEIGVRTVIFAIGYKPETMKDFVLKLENNYPDLKVHLSLEEVPLNTAGPIKLAEKHILKGTNLNFGIN